MESHGVAELLTHLRGLRPKHRLCGAFGSYGWAGGAVKEAYGEFERMGLEAVEIGPQLLTITPRGMATQEWEDCRGHRDSQYTEGELIEPLAIVDRRGRALALLLAGLASLQVVASLFARPLLKEEVIRAIQSDPETADFVQHKAVELAKNWPEDTY